MRSHYYFTLVNEKMQKLKAFKNNQKAELNTRRNTMITPIIITLLSLLSSLSSCNHNVEQWIY